MSKKGVRITAIVIAIIFFIGIVGPLAYMYVFSEPADKLQALRDEIAAAEQRVSEINAELAAAEEVERAKLEESGKRLRIMCEKGITSYLDIIFSAENLSDFTDRIVIARELMEYDRNITEAMKNIKHEISAKKAEAEALLEQKRADEAELLELEQQSSTEPRSEYVY